MTTAFLSEHGSSTARLDGELLIAHALGLRRIDLYLQFDRPLHEERLAEIRSLVRRRGRGEPVAYITGEREFYSRSFRVTPDVLVPRPETETLVEAVLLRLDTTPPGDVADLGTGSGCVAVTLAAERAGIEVAATDRSPAALEVAAQNAERHGVGHRVRTVRGDWADPLEQPVAVAVSNPPYVASDELCSLPRDVGGFEPIQALDGGPDGLAAYRAILPSLRDKLMPGALLAVETDPRRAEAVVGLMETACPGASTEVVADPAGAPRVVVARIPR